MTPIPSLRGARRCVLAAVLALVLLSPYGCSSGGGQGGACPATPPQSDQSCDGFAVGQRCSECECSILHLWGCAATASGGTGGTGGS
jgi:hypothetical protein